MLGSENGQYLLDIYNEGAYIYIYEGPDDGRGVCVDERLSLAKSLKH